MSNKKTGRTKNKYNCKRGTRRCIRKKSRRQSYTKRRRNLYGASNIDRGVEDAIKRLRENDSEWYANNVSQMQASNDNRRREIEQQEERALSSLPISRMGDPALMSRHTQIMDLAEERQNKLRDKELLSIQMNLQPINDKAEKKTFKLEGLNKINPNDFYQDTSSTSRPPRKRARRNTTKQLETAMDLSVFDSN